MKKGYVYSIGGGILILLGHIWFSNSGALLQTGGAGIYLAIGRLTGLLLSCSILFQFVIIGRVGWIEKIFGLDTLSKLHHWIGFSTIVSLVTHPVCIALAYGWGLPNSIFHKITSLLFSGDEITGATVGALLFIIITISSVYVVLKKLKYEYWYAIHLCTYIAVIISFSHQIELGGDLQETVPRTIWIVLYMCAGLIYMWFRFIKPITIYYRHRFYVDHVVEETPSVYSIYITGKNMEIFRYIPGQFIMARFLEKGVWYEAHPFSISVGKGVGNIRLTIKSSGDYTKKLPRHIHPGTRVFIEGPYGIFGNAVSKENKVLCLAGGIGITPIRSVIEQMKEKNTDVKILASFRTHTDAVFKEEISQFISDENIAFVYTHESPYEGHIQNISHTTVLNFCPDVQERSIYLCGPTAFMKTMKTILLHQGVPQNHIHYERFSL
ncbi:MAG: ferredoxin reductase family protein [Candidatus Paceibacterota bacterium]